MKKRIWTESEDNFLKENFCLTNQELAEKLNVAEDTIRRRYSTLGIERPSGKNALSRARNSLYREKQRGSVPDEWFGLPSTRSDAKEAQATFYWDGQPCKRAGHISTRKTSSGGCWECEYGDHKKRLEDPEFRTLRNEGQRVHYWKDPTKYKERQKSYKDTDRSRSWYRDYYADKRRNDLEWKIAKSLRDRLYKAVSRGDKSISAIDLVGCSIEQLITHLEGLFADGMSWDNYGMWHIDHAKPCISFDLTKKEQQKECFHYSNLRPLWANENRSKGGIWEGYDPRKKSRN